MLCESNRNHPNRYQPQKIFQNIQLRFNFEEYFINHCLSSPPQCDTFGLPPCHHQTKTWHQLWRRGKSATWCQHDKPVVEEQQLNVLTQDTSARLQAAATTYVSCKSKTRLFVQAGCSYLAPMSAAASPSWEQMECLILILWQQFWHQKDCGSDQASEAHLK